MYVPAQFNEAELPALHAAIRQSGLATLVTTGADGMEASHVPMLLDPAPAPFGRLRGHLSRGNPQWRRTDATTDALAIFLGPDAYITPSWYPTKQATGKVVPTWNYVAIHAYGRPRFFDDRAELLALVTELTQRHEGQRPQPWAVTDAPEEFIAAQLNGIIGFELPVTRLEGKWKMSQNRPPEDRVGVVEGLRHDGNPAVADIVAAKNQG